MPILSFKQGEDKKIPVIVIDDPAIDFTTADEVRIVLFVGTAEQDRFSIATIADHGKLTIDDTDKNKLYVFSERAKTVAYNAGSLAATVLATFANAAFPDGFETRTWDVSNVGRVLAGRALNEEI